MVRKLISTFLLLAAAVFIVAPITACGDDVKKVEQIEQTHESEPEMQSPGEFVVE